MAFIGFGAAFLGKAFVASLSGDTSTRMGVMHALYGVGAMCTPLVSTQFAQLPRWSFGYLVHTGLALTSAVFTALTSKFKSQGGVSSHRVLAASACYLYATHWLAHHMVAGCLKEVGEPLHEKTDDSLKGTNNTIGGWIVTFVIDKRHGGPSAGYISSGFFGGLTIGPLALLPLNKKAIVLALWEPGTAALQSPIFIRQAIEPSHFANPCFVYSRFALAYMGY
ncbi:hypothetical protein LXA43DRAFT_1057434 [Ganoderma leucocontextum]|nr:hypothetical protein LXA43DRAFT_1057434 [Ganoderma leucocontextum]